MATVNRILCLSLLVAALCCPLSSCRRGASVSISPVTGHVTLGGKPLANAEIFFEDRKLGFGAMAIVAEDGSYTLRSQYGNGIPPGDYAVSISPGSTRDQFDRPVTSKVTVPEKFQRSQTSGLSASVKQGKNNFDFNLNPS